MFYTTAEDYLYPLKNPIYDPKGENVFLPMELDTEFYHPPYNLKNPSNEICINLTAQCRGLTDEVGMIFAHPDIAGIARHPVFKNQLVVIDYLLAKGYEAKMNRLQSWNTPTELPWLQIDAIAYFALAELYRICLGEFQTDINQLAVHPTKYGAIDQARRVRTFNQVGTQYQSFVEMPWVITINDHSYRLRFSLLDTGAIHGNSSYQKVAENAGIELLYKDNFTKEQKGKMLEMYQQYPEDFDNYALGDLNNHPILMANLDKFKTICDNIGISNYFKPPKLTIGSTVANIIVGCINKVFNNDVNDKKYINAFCKPGTADYIKQMKTTTACLNAKVDGGRCRNNRPIDTVAKGVICDIDISGCYGEGLRVQLYPLGVPVIIDYPFDSKINQYQTLREFEKKYNKELVPGLWQARVSCKEGYILEHKQDFLISWIPPKDISKMPTDESFQETDEWWTVDNVGEIKIFTNEVKHALINHDFMQWLYQVASPKQRKELLDNLVVETAMYYPASDKVNSTDELIKAHEEHSGKNQTFATKKRGRTTKIKVEQECHKWYAVNLGDLVVNTLLLERKKYPKKTPYNELYKLCINTIYGDMVSPFFTVGNVVVGNNITARARTLAWYMEKGLHGWQSITDGCAFNLNGVTIPRKDYSLNGEYAAKMYLMRSGANHYLKSLGSDLTVTLKSDAHELVTEGNNTVLKTTLDSECVIRSYDEAKKWVDKQAMKHLQTLFTNVDVLHQTTNDVYGNLRIGQFEFESKGFYDTAIFHGTANYALSLNGINEYKMRSYSKKEHKIVGLADELQIIDEDVKPSEVFLNQLSNPDRIKRSNVFLKTGILKIGDYRKNYESYKYSSIYPGCTIEKPALLREFSLSQFTFQTIEQYQSWRREYQKLMRKYGQSYEMFFLNEDGTLNYQRMIERIDEKINEGRKDIFDGVDKRTANVYRSYLKHIEQDCLEATRQALGVRYNNPKYATDTDIEVEYEIVEYED